MLPARRTVPIYRIPRCQIRCTDDVRMNRRILEIIFLLLFTVNVCSKILKKNTYNDLLLTLFIYDLNILLLRLLKSLKLKEIKNQRKNSKKIKIDISIMQNDRLIHHLRNEKKNLNIENFI